MRRTGEVKSAADLGFHDHLCWPFHGAADFADPAIAALTGGLALGLRVELLVPGASPPTAWTSADSGTSTPCSGGARCA